MPYFIDEKPRESPASEFLTQTRAWSNTGHISLTFSPTEGSHFLVLDMSRAAPHPQHFLTSDLLVKDCFWLSAWQCLDSGGTDENDR